MKAYLKNTPKLVLILAAVLFLALPFGYGYLMLNQEIAELGADVVATLPQAAITQAYINHVLIGFAVSAVCAVAFVAIVNAAIKGKAGIANFFRMKMVALKRNPQMLPLLMMVAAFLVYALNLTNMSDSTAKVGREHMGLCQFVIMLVSILSLVCLLNAFPKRKKANVPMVVLAMVMFAIVVFCAIFYRNNIIAALDLNNPNHVDLTVEMAAAYNMLQTYIILVALTAVLVLTLPLYSKLFKKIKTSIAVEDNGDVGDIELTD